MKIKINKETIELKNTLRSILVFEQITNKPFSLNGMTDIMIYFYSVIIASEPNVELTFDEFMSYLDENQEVFQEFNEWLIKVNSKNDTISTVKKKKVNK